MKSEKPRVETYTLLAAMREHLLVYIFPGLTIANVFGHRTMKVSHPVRSAVNKHRIAWLVLQWVTMWESQVLNP